MVNRELIYELWTGEKSIGFFVHLNKYYWLIDDKSNFCLDAEPEYKAYLESEIITLKQYELSCKEFRGGVLRLDEHNFFNYLKCKSVEVKSSDEMKKLLFDELSNQQLMDLVTQYTNNEELTRDAFTTAHQLKSRLPLFYFNFDEHLFYHIDCERFHESTIYGDWRAENKSFESIIPESEKYWIYHNIDYGKICM